MGKCKWQSSQWVGDKATESLLTATNCSFFPTGQEETLHCLNAETPKDELLLWQTSSALI